MRKLFSFSLLLLSLTPLMSMAQDENLTEGLEISAEAQASLSDDKTPLWLNANKYGLSSLEKSNGYLRSSAIRPLEADKNREWKWGYGLDLAVAANYTSSFIIHQAYGELGWKKMKLTLGAKEQTALMKNMELSSGAMSCGWNARPIPQARLDIDWFDIPRTHGWWKWKLYGSYGMTTDGNWQKSFTTRTFRYTGNTLYHEKALYWKFGKEDSKIPITFELGLQMQAQFGGKTLNATGRGYHYATTIKHPVNFNAFLNALLAQGSDETDGVDKNTSGNHMGSWNMRLSYYGADWNIGARFERYFEDQSMMFIQYGIYDHLLGIDVSINKSRLISTITIEHLSTTNQSGAIYHDFTVNIPEKMNGIDNYYNHHLYSGNQHWGQAIGNPLLTSPIYNEDGIITFHNNRVKAWHIGLSGDPYNWIHWRALATLTRNWGTYLAPYDDVLKQNHFLFEVTVKPYFTKYWHFGLSFGLDHGKTVGNNKGFQLTVSRVLSFSSN